MTEGIIIGLAFAISGILFAVIVSLIQMKKTSETDFRCPICGKIFSPRFWQSFSTIFNYGDGSVPLRCPHCHAKERMKPIKK